MGRIFFTLSLVIFIVGCAPTAVGSYDSMRLFPESLPGSLAREIANYEGPTRRPIVVVHGLLGARLLNTATNTTVWGVFSARSFNSAFYRDLSHPMWRGSPLKQLRDSIIPTEFLLNAEINLLGMTFERQGYAHMINMLKSAGYTLEGEPLPEGKGYHTLFLFAYDWRRDPVENAANLGRFIKAKHNQLGNIYHERYGTDPEALKFDVIAHSMGGLVARYFLMYGERDLPMDGTPPMLDWGGSKYISRLAILGTPNAGYLDTVIEMTSGLSIAPTAPIIPPAVLATMPSYYAMLPANDAGGVVLDADGNHLDIFDPKVWIRHRWGLADPSQDAVLQVLMPGVPDRAVRHAIAIDHMEKCLDRARNLSIALSVDLPPPPHVRMALFAGDAVRTSSVCRVNRATGRPAVTAYDIGDGKVLASSARYDRFHGTDWRLQYDSPIKWDSTIYLPAAHMGITGSNTFTANLLGFLLLTATDERVDFSIEAD